MGVKVVTGKVRLSWPDVFEPVTSPQDDKLKYRVMLLIPKSDKATYDKLVAAEKQTAEEEKAKFPGGKVPKKLASIIHDGDGENERTGELHAEKYPERKGHWFMSVTANEGYPPKVVDQKLNPILDRSEIYSGVYARVSLRSYAYNAAGNMGISFGLANVQKVADGEPLGGTGSDPTDDFDEIADDDLI